MDSRKEPSGRLDYLDSMRGIAATMILVFHCLLLSSKNSFSSIDYHIAFDSIYNFCLYLLHKLQTQGHSAVIFFFVLSGFVLASSLAKHKTTYVGFLVRRLFRIYPAFFFAVIGSYILHTWIGSTAAADDSAWFRDAVANPSLARDVLFMHLSMRGRVQDIGLDSAIWSLIHEMRISLFFPLIFAIVHKYRLRTLLGFFLLSLLCVHAALISARVAPKGFLETTDIMSWTTTLYFIVMFVAGILLSLERERVARAVGKLPAIAKYGLLLFALLGLSKAEGAVQSWQSAMLDYLYCIDAALLIALALGFGDFRDILRKRLLIWLGRISYSLYLIHVPIIYVVYSLLKPSQPLELIIAISIAVSLLLAEFMVVAIESPFMQLGKTLSQKLAGKMSFKKYSFAQVVLPDIPSLKAPMD